MDKIKARLANTISEKRVAHSIRVMEVAKELADRYDVDREKASVAALLHDCARYEDEAYLLKRSKEFDIVLDNIYRENINLLHAPLGAKVAKKEYGISDKEILNSIKYHTTGREDMSMVEKIVYISDYIEPQRDFEGIDEIRKLSYRGDIDKAIIKSIDNSIIYILNKEIVLHEDTIKTRNYLLYNI